MLQGGQPITCSVQTLQQDVLIASGNQHGLIAKQTPSVIQVLICRLDLHRPSEGV